MVDEAQHATTTDAGSDSLFALKAARDELNSTRHHGLRLVATGSNRDKLALLVMYALEHPQLAALMHREGLIRPREGRR